MSQTLRPAERIRRRPEFLLAYEQGTKQHGRFMTVFVRRSGLGVGRLGVSATRKIGPAVVRNKAKRRARELFRHAKPDAGLDLVIIPRREFASAPFDRLEADYHAVVRRAIAGARSRREPDRAG
jgi:ribonuclease P protein component